MPSQMVISSSFIPKKSWPIYSKMILKFLTKLTSRRAQDGERSRNLETVTYKGYTIVPAPKQDRGQWTTEGYISKEIDGVSKSEHFIRVDTHGARDEAASYSILKAKNIIDEKGDALFKDK